MGTAVIAWLIAYVAGSIPSAVWVGKLWKGVDVRTVGSGNMGATNVYRTLGTAPAIVVALLDIAKGLLPVLLLSPVVAGRLGWGIVESGLTVGALTIVGHIFPAFAKFRGGKGVLTALGVFVALAPVEAAVALAVFVLAFAITRIVSVGSLLASLALSLTAFIRWRGAGQGGYSLTLLFACVTATVLLLFTHRSNLKRLIKGEEARLGKTKE